MLFGWTWRESILSYVDAPAFAPPGDTDYLSFERWDETRYVCADLPYYSQDIAAAWLVVERMHAGISPAEMGRYNYLTLVCTGHYGTNWCASFDFNLSHDWFEADILPSCPFAARANTASEAVCRAALKAVEGAS